MALKNFNCFLDTKQIHRSVNYKTKKVIIIYEHINYAVHSGPHNERGEPRSKDLGSPSFRPVQNKTLGTRIFWRNVVRDALYLQSYLRVFAETGKE